MTRAICSSGRLPIGWSPWANTFSSGNIVTRTTSRETSSLSLNIGRSAKMLGEKSYAGTGGKIQCARRDIIVCALWHSCTATLGRECCRETREPVGSPGPLNPASIPNRAKSLDAVRSNEPTPALLWLSHQPLSHEDRPVAQPPRWWHARGHVGVCGTFFALLTVRSRPVRRVADVPSASQCQERRQTTPASTAAGS